MSFESVQEMFSRTAAEFGPRVAVDRVGRQVTYAELEAESNRVGNFLLEQGAKKGTRVGLLSGDPVRVITAILGVLKAGAVFVPLDPTFPDGRLRTMTEQVAPEWYLTEEKHLEKLARLTNGATSHARVICLDQTAASQHADLEVVENYHEYQKTSSPDLHSDPEAPCSIYFTSGSTGKPKAILGRLKGIDHYIRWHIETLGVGPGTRVTQLASPSFDGFLKDAFVPLCAGGVSCVPESRNILLNAEQLADWLDIEQVEVVHCVPSVFRALINQNLNSGYFAAMKCVLMTGETLYPVDVKRWMDVFGERIKLLNVYGTTETTISKVAYEVKAADVERASIPIGKPIKGSAVLLINSRGQLCRGEAVGEIHLRTPYRSHGYYEAPELTRAVFIQNPFSDDPNDILYKTGDYARLLEDGNLEFLGRRDQQVQVRGVRVELGEIENLLRGHDAVTDVVVVDRDDAEGNKFLIAYVVMNNGTGSAPLRQHLARHVPETMLPSAFIELDQLPRTLNGKIDRKALPSLESLRAEQENQPNLTPVEEIVAGIWREVLRLPAVSRSGNFFNLGGHSLLVTQVLARVRDYLKIELPVRSLFESPTLEEFSQLVQEQISHGRQSELTAIGRVSRDGELPLSFSQQRMWFLEQLSSGTSAFNIALGVRLEGPLNVEALEQTFSEMIRRHEILRTVFAAVNTEAIQRIQPPPTFKLPVVDLSMLSADKGERAAARLAQEETLRLFDLGNGPLVRPTLLRLNDREHIIICTMHHIVGDGQSFEVVVLEMSQIYSALVQGQPSPLPELNVQYVDYAAWQRQWLQEDELETRLAYWRKQLAGAPWQLNLPHRRSRPKAQDFKGARHPAQLSPAETEALRELSRREGMTLFMTMLSVFVLLLKLYTGDDDVVVGSVYANRERADLEKLIGILNNTLVLRVNLTGAVSFKDVMKRVRDVCLDAYTYQVPPELLREDMVKRGEEPERLFDAWFQLERAKQEVFDMKDLTVTPYHEAREVTRFELSIGFTEYDDTLSGAIEYDENMFTAKTASQMLGDYVRLLTSMVANPSGEISTLSLTTSDELEQLSSSFAGSLEA